MSETLKNYDRWSTSYDAQDNPMVGATEWALEMMPFECSGQDVLELGCGTGRHVARVLDSGARSYVGLDGSPGMLAVARARHGGPRAIFVEADIGERLPLSNATFDSVLVVLVLEHVTDLDVTFAEIARVLRPGGRLRIVEIHPSLVASGTAAHFRDAAGEFRFESFAHPVATVVSALRCAGLEPNAVREVVAAGDLVKRVPKMAKHYGRPVVLDLESARAA